MFLGRCLQVGEDHTLGCESRVKLHSDAARHKHDLPTVLVGDQGSKQFRWHRWQILVSAFGRQPE